MHNEEEVLEDNDTQQRSFSASVGRRAAVLLGVCVLAGVLSYAEPAFAQSILGSIEAKATALKDGILALAKIVLVVFLIFFGVQVARGDRDATSKAILAFVGILVVFNADAIIAFIGSP